MFLSVVNQVIVKKPGFQKTKNQTRSKVHHFTFLLLLQKIRL